MYGTMGSDHRSSSPVLLLDYCYRSRGRRRLGSSPPSPPPGFPSWATWGLLQQQEDGAVGCRRLPCPPQGNDIKQGKVNDIKYGEIFGSHGDDRCPDVHGGCGLDVLRSDVLGRCGVAALKVVVLPL